MKYFIPLFIGLAAVWPYFAQRLAKENTLEDIQLTTSLKSSEDFEGGGNFVFRMAIFLERSEYLLKKIYSYLGLVLSMKIQNTLKRLSISVMVLIVL